VQASTNHARENRFLVVTAWTLTLFASLLPTILWNELAGGGAVWITWARLIVLGALIPAASLFRQLRPLRSFIVVLFVMNAAPELVSRINISLPFIEDVLGGGPFIRRMQPEQFADLVVSLIMIAVLLILGFRRQSIFLTAGKLNAPITPVRWMGFPKPDPWTSFGGQYSIYIPLGIGLALWLLSRLPFSVLGQVVPVLPGVLLFAALNAFNEEMTFRAPMLATLELPAGARPALWMSALFFGIGHFYGVPYGWLGILLAAFSGWLLGKAMLETRGLFWAWWMHFLQDVVIFIFIATGGVTPGG
jgi:membrane protease YdiL (CAAX protease family)